MASRTFQKEVLPFRFTEGASLEIGSLNGGLVTLPSSATTDITVPNNARSILFILSNTGSIILISASSSGVVSVKNIDGNSSIVATTAKNTLSIQNNTTANLSAAWFDFNGKTLS